MIKQSLLNLMQVSGAFDLMRFISRHRALILTYHRFSERADGVSISARAFAEQSDLPLRKEVSLGAAQLDRAHRNAFPHQGDAQDRAEAHTSGDLARLREFRHLGLHVREEVSA